MAGKYDPISSGAIFRVSLDSFRSPAPRTKTYTTFSSPQLNHSIKPQFVQHKPCARFSRGTFESIFAQSPIPKIAANFKSLAPQNSVSTQSACENLDFQEKSTTPVHTLPNSSFSADLDLVSVKPKPCQSTETHSEFRIKFAQPLQSNGRAIKLDFSSGETIGCDNEAQTTLSNPKLTNESKKESKQQYTENTREPNDTDIHSPGNSLSSPQLLTTRQFQISGNISTQDSEENSPYRDEMLQKQSLIKLQDDPQSKEVSNKRPETKSRAKKIRDKNLKSNETIERKSTRSSNLRNKRNSKVVEKDEGSLQRIGMEKRKTKVVQDSMRNDQVASTEYSPSMKTPLKTKAGESPKRSNKSEKSKRVKKSETTTADDKLNSLGVCIPLDDFEDISVSRSGRKLIPRQPYWAGWRPKYDAKGNVISLTGSKIIWDGDRNVFQDTKRKLCDSSDDFECPKKKNRTKVDLSQTSEESEFHVSKDLEMQEKKTKNRDISDANWSAEELRKLRKAYTNTPSSQDLWIKISAQVETKSAEECCRKWWDLYESRSLQKTISEHRERAKKSKFDKKARSNVIRGGKGTALRRKSTRKIADKLFFGAVDDIFSAQKENGSKKDNLKEDGLKEIQSLSPTSTDQLETSPGILTKSINWDKLDEYTAQVKRSKRLEKRPTRVGLSKSHTNAKQSKSFKQNTPKPKKSIAIAQKVGNKKLTGNLTPRGSVSVVINKDSLSDDFEEQEKDEDEEQDEDEED